MSYRPLEIKPPEHVEQHALAPSQPLESIDADLQRLGAEITELLNAIVKPGEVRA